MLSAGWFTAIAVFALCSGAFFFFIHYGDSKKGDQRLSNGGKVYYWYHRPRRGKSPAQSRLAIDAELPIEFSIHRTNPMHAIAKWLGATAEMEITDPEFDETFFITSDDVELRHKLCGDGELRKAIKALFDFGLDGLTADRGRLTAILKNPQSVLSPSDEDLLIEPLYVLDHKLKHLALSLTTQGSGERRRIEADLLKSMFNALALVSFCALSMLPHHIYDMEKFITYGMTFAAALIIAQLIWLRARYGHSSYGYSVFVHFAFSGIVGTAMFAHILIWNINISFDHAPAAARYQQVVDRYTSRHKNSTYYHLKIRDWHDGNQSFSRKVSYETYQRSPKGSKVHIETHPGYLGIEWYKL